jgi:hypothetical protein
MNIDVTYDRAVYLRRVLKMASPKLVPAPVTVAASTVSRVKDGIPLVKVKYAATCFENEDRVLLHPPSVYLVHM